jgi:hypothetical protein
VFVKLLDACVFNAVTINPDFGCVEWPGGIDLDPDTMHRTIAGVDSGTPLYPAGALREEPKKKQ